MPTLTQRAVQSGAPTSCPVQNLPATPPPKPPPGQVCKDNLLSSTDGGKPGLLRWERENLQALTREAARGYQLLNLKSQEENKGKRMALQLGLYLGPEIPDGLLWGFFRVTPILASIYTGEI